MSSRGNLTVLAAVIAFGLAAGQVATAGAAPATSPMLDASTPVIATVANNSRSVTSPPFSPPAGSVLYAAFSMDSYPGSGMDVASVTNTGPGVTWHLTGLETHTDRSSVGGFVEVFWAYEASGATGMTVTGTFNTPSKNVAPPVGALQVLVMDHAAADQTSSAWTPTWDVVNGARPSTTVITTSPESRVFGVFDNWDSSAVPVLPGGQTLRLKGHPAIVLNPTDRDTYWLQNRPSPVAPLESVTLKALSLHVRFHAIAWEVRNG